MKQVMARTLIVLMLFMANAVTPSYAADLKAAAALGGLNTGMAAGCGFDSKPVLVELRALFDSSGITQAEREQLNEIVATSTGLALNLQSGKDAMPCSEVRTRMDSAIKTLRSMR